MDNKSKHVSHPQTAKRGNWTGTQAYILAVFCLVLGVALGYLFRGSASPARRPPQRPLPADGSATQGTSTQAQVTPEQQKAMLDQAVAPLLETLKTSPDDFDTIVKVANLYYDGRQYPDAIKYYQLAAKSQPKNADLLTDLGTSLWYTGDADGAIAEFQTGAEVSARSSRNAVQPGHSSLARQERSEGRGRGLGRVAAKEPELPAETATPGIHRARPSSTPRGRSAAPPQACALRHIQRAWNCRS